jgi:hypothetical protein
MVSRVTQPGTSTPARLGTRPFLEEVRDSALAALPASLGAPHSRVVFTSLQVHFGDPRLHYEVWPVRKTGRIELGLHLEGPQEWSRTLAMQLAAHADELRAALGPAYELEDWTASWCRLHRTLPLRRLDTALAAEVGGSLAALIAATEPLVRRLNPIPAAGGGAGSARGRRRRRR